MLVRCIKFQVVLTTIIIPIRKIDWVSNGVNGVVTEGGDGVTIRIMV